MIVLPPIDGYPYITTVVPISGSIAELTIIGVIFFGGACISSSAKSETVSYAFRIAVDVQIGADFVFCG